MQTEEERIDQLIDLRPCQHDDGYTDGRSHIKVLTDERTQIHSAQSSHMVTHPSTNRARRYLTFVTKQVSAATAGLKEEKRFEFRMKLRHI